MSSNFVPLTAQELVTKINKIPRVSLALLPTVLEFAPNISKELGIKQFVQKIAHGLDNGVNYATMPAIDKSGKTDYQIYPPREKKNKVNYIKGSDDKIIIKD